MGLTNNVVGMVRWRVFTSIGAERPLMVVGTEAQKTRVRWPFRARYGSGSKGCGPICWLPDNPIFLVE
jgi:hypothetical protein